MPLLLLLSAKKLGVSCAQLWVGTGSGMKQPAVYILASRRNGTLYIGVTSDLIKRTWEHKNGVVDGFSHKYGVSRLVYFELHPDMPTAIQREKQLKEWNRSWKIRLIESCNPYWNDLWEELIRQ